jgi:hypothetical protein
MLTSSASRLGEGERLVGVALQAGKTDIAYMRMFSNPRINTSRRRGGETEICGIIFMLHYTGCLIRDESFEEWLRERDVELLNIIRRIKYLVMKKNRDLM